jgi:hypothetical protein
MDCQSRGRNRFCSRTKSETFAMVAFQALKRAASRSLAKRVVWEFQISAFFAARKSPKNAKILFDATPYAATTSDPFRAIFKNINGFEPHDLIDLDS